MSLERPCVILGHPHSKTNSTWILLCVMLKFPPVCRSRRRNRIGPLLLFLSLEWCHILTCSCRCRNSMLSVLKWNGNTVRTTKHATLQTYFLCNQSSNKPPLSRNLATSSPNFTYIIENKTSLPDHIYIENNEVMLSSKLGWNPWVNSLQYTVWFWWRQWPWQCGSKGGGTSRGSGSFQFEKTTKRSPPMLGLHLC